LNVKNYFNDENFLSQFQLVLSLRKKPLESSYFISLPAPPKNVTISVQLV
jgi:hypothetical protein